ncbi:MAG: hypothetical protein ABEJ42_02115 [Halobacteriaceae archaeon]
MAPTIEVSEETLRELDDHRQRFEDYDELLQELLNIYEDDARFVREGYSE